MAGPPSGEQVQCGAADEGVGSGRPAIETPRQDDSAHPMHELVKEPANLSGARGFAQTDAPIGGPIDSSHRPPCRRRRIIMHPEALGADTRRTPSSCQGRESPLLLVRIGYGLTLLASLAAFAVRIGR